MDDQFEARLAAWLDDPEAETSGDAFSPVAAGYAITKRAIAEADSHESCGRDAREFTVLIGVAGEDGEETIHEIPPETTLMCVLGALAQDPETAGMRVIGILVDDEDPPAGIRVVSENPDIAVSWAPEEPEVQAFPRALPSPRHRRPSRWARLRRYLAAQAHGAQDTGPVPGAPYTYPMTEDTPAPPDEVGPFDESEAA